ncbi:protease inhibitor I42 family protein [Nocardia uniformis]|uniref:Protease inhibitor I42 family protein n=1 Tax=Nocardia uniformis TaxID=53432 RepID=A0A849CGD3_9NOCA|nr:protease inhibitor I42 family protein [Nocardia uniformis]NNH72501.1 protease inhibitor I42 family protein [Nocardia uniformis]
MVRTTVLIALLGLSLVACSNGDSDSDHQPLTSTVVAESSKPTSSSAQPTSSGEHATSTTAPTAAPLTVDDSADGTEVRLVPDQKLVVRLPANNSTGYAWSVQKVDEDTLKQDGNPEYKPDPQPEGHVGGGGTSIWSFQAGKPGDTTLELVYFRPWEEPVDSDKRFTLTVRVQ